jgi:hypothetical protein
MTPSSKLVNNCWFLTFIPDYWRKTGPRFGIVFLPPSQIVCSNITLNLWVKISVLTLEIPLWLDSDSVFIKCILGVKKSESLDTLLRVTSNRWKVRTEARVFSAVQLSLQSMVRLSEYLIFFLPSFLNTSVACLLALWL